MELRPFVRPPIVTELDDLEALEPGHHRRRLVITENATGNETMIPVVIVRGSQPGPVVGVTAAVHGNELNGIPVIHRLLVTLEDNLLLRGTVIAAPIVNVPGYLRQQREFEDGTDLNRIMPGRAGGDESAFYANRLTERLIRRFEYLFDLHTASFGRVNSLYVRADMNAEVPAHMARTVAPQIIVHNPPGDGTVRGAAEDLGIHAITVEVGDPQRYQPGLVRSARLGIQEFLEELGMLADAGDPDGDGVVQCSRSYWMYTDRGGVLRVLPKVCDLVAKGEVVARLRNVWGDLVREYVAPEAGIVVGKSTNPAARAGSRILHLGIVGPPGQPG